MGSSPLVAVATRPIALPVPISLSRGNSASSLPEPLNALIAAREAAESVLQSPQLEQELSEGTAGPSILALKAQLVDMIALAKVWKAGHGRKVSPEHDARAHFVLAWALGRVGEFDGTTPEELPAKLADALLSYADAARLLDLPAPPTLDAVPSVTRPNEKTLPLVLGEQPAWVAEFLAEYARTQTTLAFSMLLLHDQIIEEAKLADLLDLACRRNVQGASILSVQSRVNALNSHPHLSPNSPLHPRRPAHRLGRDELYRDRHG